MLKRILCCALALAAALLLLPGCNGDGSSVLNPVFNLTYPDTTSLPSLPDNVPLVIKGDAATADKDSNPITSYQWTQTPVGAGVFNSPNTFGTTWMAKPGFTGPVTLTLTAGTKLGGKSAMNINLVVYHSLLTNPTIALPAGLDGMTLKAGTSVQLTPTVTPVIGGDIVTTATWTESTGLGAFTTPNTVTTTWTPAAGSGGKDATLTLTVTTATNGTASKTFTIHVIP